MRPPPLRLIDPPMVNAGPSPAPSPAAAGDSVQRYTEGDALYAAMLADIESATQGVRMESYIYASDEIGLAFASALIARARAGCEVRPRVDALGSFDTLDDSLARALVEGGVKLEWCHRWNWRRPLAIHRRNHRKLLIVDGRCAYLGESGWCSLHTKAGPAAKPLGCALFPASFLDDGERIRVSTWVECACVLASVGRPGGAVLDAQHHREHGAGLTGALDQGMPQTRQPRGRQTE